MPKQKLPPCELWIEKQFDAISAEAFANAADKLFGSERGCQAVFLALMAIHDAAEDNDDSEMMDACQMVLRGLALARLAYEK